MISGRTSWAGVLLLPLITAVAVAAGDWPQWRGPNRDAAWEETGLLETFPPDGLAVEWSTPAGIGFSSPVVASGRVYVTGSELLSRPKARERVQAQDAETGRPLWSYTYEIDYPETAFDPNYPTGPIATPIVADGRIYTLGAVGSLLCFDAVHGAVLWQHDIQKDYPASRLCVSPSPLIEGELLIVFVGAKPDASVIAFDKRTGREVWKALNEGSESASSPIVIDFAGVHQLIVWTERSVTSLAPATGQVLWSQPLITTMDAAVSTPVYHDGRLLIGGLMLALDGEKPGASILWPKSRAVTRRILSNTSTALVLNGYVYSAKSSGEFVCLDASTGKEVWVTDKVTEPKSGASVHLTANGQSVLMYNDQGELIRARLTPEGYREISRARVLQPATTFSGRKTAWAAPAYANRRIYARTNKELVCASLGVDP